MEAAQLYASLFFESKDIYNDGVSLHGPFSGRSGRSCELDRSD